MQTRIATDADATMPIEAQSGEGRHDRAAKPVFADLVEDVFPIKGPAAITHYAGCPDRTSRSYSGGHRNPPWTVLHDLLRGNEGYRVLVWVMRGSAVTWWLVIQHERAVYARLKDLSPQLREIVDGC